MKKHVSKIVEILLHCNDAHKLVLASRASSQPQAGPALRPL